MSEFTENRKPAVFLLENLGCAHCAAKMEERICRLDQVEYASITFATKQLRILAKDPMALVPEIQNICSSIESQVQVIPQETKSGKERKSVSKKEEKNSDLPQIIIGAALFIAGSLISHFYEDTRIVLGIFLIAYLILGGKILLEAARNIAHGQIFDENFLMCVATIGAFVIREYPEAVGVMLFYRIGEYFEEKAVERSRSQIMEAADMRPEVVNLVMGDQISVIDAEDASIGDILLIRPGDRIPLDGKVISGESRIDTSPVTGEPVPVSARPGDRIISGCVNTSGQLQMQVEKTLSESMVTRILDSVENAAASKPKLDRFITRFAKVYTPCVIFLAAATAIIPSLVSGNWNYWIYTALTFLVMSCPCALVLSVPLAFFSGIGVGSKNGILFKGGASLEFLTDLGAVVMDKTGTITEGNFCLQEIKSVGRHSEEAMLRICASCEQFSTHPIALSIVHAAGERKLSLSRPVMVKEIAGHGISAFLPEGKVLCGNRKMMEDNGIHMNFSDEELNGSEVFLSIDGDFAGYFIISDTIKTDAGSAVSRLKALGLHTVMLTGDSEKTANAVAKETGIDTVYARLLPEDKLTILQEIRRRYGSVMFVGDGINDAPVLAGADVGAAMGSGADAAIEAADAVFMNSSVASIPQAIEIARKTNRIALQNVIFALAVKIIVMGLGLAGFANMWMAVFADTGVAMICVVNSIRMLYYKK
ncbi:MAG: heavy metal translocating P-type ATPase [Lachnospiraceae bacterium]